MSLMSVISERKMRNIKFLKSGKSWITEYFIKDSNITYNIHIAPNEIYYSMSDMALDRKSLSDLDNKQLNDLTKWYDKIKSKLSEMDIKLRELV